MLALAQGLPANWRLAWSDDFDQLDRERWELVDTPRPTNNSQQDYLSEQVTVSDGKLILLSENRPSRGLPYRSGQVRSRDEQRWGRWEVRAKLPTTRGMWPAIWLLPRTDKYPWPSGGEIDFMESRGDAPQLVSSAFHFGSPKPAWHAYVEGRHQSGKEGTLTNFHAGFHTYAVDWTETLVRFYVDDVHHYTVHDEEVAGFLSAKTAPMRLIINNAVGGDFLNDPDDSTVWPQRMEIDWVRVYVAEEGEAPPRGTDPKQSVLSNGGFEQNGGTLAGWSVINNAVIGNPNVSISTAHASEGVASLKIFGAFAGSPTRSGIAQGVRVVAGQRVACGGRACTIPEDTVIGSSNRALLRLEFYPYFGAATPLAEEEVAFDFAQAEVGEWVTQQIAANVPAGATEARVSVLLDQPKNEGGAVFLDDLRMRLGTPATR
ncbi:family 16 glycosylhydrolase [Botrimarina hoheduenensis]|nr:family 16 glycosylhydrolase [Botrimarina hoheduenensis]